jgi:hypothetical protein
MPDIKGSAVRDAVATHIEHRNEEYQRVLARLDPPTRRLFLGQIPSNGWFPLDAFAHYLAAKVIESGEPAEALVGRAELVVERQLRGIYRVFAMLLSAESMVAKITAINATYFRGVQVERTPSGNHGAVIRYIGFESRHHLMEFIIVGFYRKALEICGARNVQAEWTPPISGTRGYAELAVSCE